MLYHMIAFLAGFLLDLIFGDPYWMPHPIRLIGNLIAKLDKGLLGEPGEERNPKKEHNKGRLLVLLVLLITLIPTAVLVIGAYMIHPILGVIVEAILTYYILATKCLKKESMKVYSKLKENDLQAARYAVSMIVGRDTANLDETGVAKAAIETVAENAADGVVAPMIYTAIGGPILGFIYKAINTMDSMVGYKNDRYMNFGTVAAKTDDLANYLPARISAGFMIFSCYFLGKEFNGQKARYIFRRDRYNHKSPNSAQTESTTAGALGIQLAGSAYYFGKLVEKPTIGDATRPVEYEDIKRANKLLYGAAITSEVACLAVLGLIALIIYL